MEETWLEEFQKLAVTRGPCRTAVDIGANVGDWSEWMAGHFDRVLAIEPDPRAFAALLDRDLPENVVASNMAVAGASGTTTLLMRPSPLQSSLLEIHPVGVAGQPDPPVVKTVEVPAFRLDELLEMNEHIDFVKLDIEGGEAAVLTAATDPRWRDTRWLIEVHDTSQAVGAFLERVGFENLRMMRHPCPGAHSGHFWIYVDKELTDGRENTG